MSINTQKVGSYISCLRKQKNITQNELGERLSISYQAVSKWERGETLPDTSILLDLATILETTVDNILNGSERILEFNKKISVKDIKQGIESLASVGMLIGKSNSIYAGMIEGINLKMNMDVEQCWGDDYLKEILIAEVIIQELQNGCYVDLTEVKSIIANDQVLNIIKDYTKQYGIK